MTRTCCFLQLPEDKAFDFLERVKMRDKLQEDLRAGRHIEAQRRIYIALPTPETRHLHSEETVRRCMRFRLPTVFPMSLGDQISKQRSVLTVS